MLNGITWRLHTCRQSRKHIHLIASRHDANSGQLIAADLCHADRSQQTNLTGSKLHATRQHQLTFLDVTANRSAGQQQLTIFTWSLPFQPQPSQSTMNQSKHVYSEAHHCNDYMSCSSYATRSRPAHVAQWSKHSGAMCSIARRTQEPGFNYKPQPGWVRLPKKSQTGKEGSMVSSVNCDRLISSVKCWLRWRGWSK